MSTSSFQSDLSVDPDLEVSPKSPGISETDGASQTDEVLHTLKDVLKTDATVKYVVVPAMVGGLGSVALQMVQDGGNFVVESEEQPPEHDFIPAIQTHAGVEFSVLVASSVLLGAVVGYIGAILTLDGPPKDSNNKSKLAATALMFALFFPSVITVLQQNVESQANQINFEKVQDLTEKAQEESQRADKLEQLVENRITQSNETLDETLDDVNATLTTTDGDNRPDVLTGEMQSNQLEDAQSRIIREKKSLIEDNQALVVTASSNAKAREFINNIFEIGNVDVEDGIEDVRTYAIQTLEDINKNSDIDAELQTAAKEKAEELMATRPDVPE